MNWELSFTFVRDWIQGALLPGCIRKGLILTTLAANVLGSGGDEEYDPLVKPSQRFLEAMSATEQLKPVLLSPVYFLKVAWKDWGCRR